MDNKQMREDFAAAVRATEKCVRPWRIATGVLSLAVIVLVTVAVAK